MHLPSHPRISSDEPRAMRCTRNMRVIGQQTSAAILLWAACGTTACGSDTQSGAGPNAAGATSNAGTAGSSSAGANSGGANSGGGPSASGGRADSNTGGAMTSGNAGASTGGSGQTGSGPLLASAVFYQDISKASLDAESDRVTGALQAIGWGDPGSRTTLGIDFSFEINRADDSVVPRAFTQPADALPDCDTAPVPLPPAGKIEGKSNYACSNEDCHLLVYQGTRLYELYQANVTGGNAVGGAFSGGCLVVWDLTRDYWQPKEAPNFGRGDGCNGADAGGLPIAPLLITKAELAAGAISHALRFTIENNRIRAAVYVHPATHIGGPSGDDTMPPYGARLRLRGDYDLASFPSEAARAVAKALQTYGMYLADGGNSYVSATTDASDVMNSSGLTALEPKDFQMVEAGARINWKAQNCSRTPTAK